MKKSNLKKLKLDFFIYVMEKHYFCGLQRSGNHAFIKWYISHLDDYLYWNNVSDDGKPEQIEKNGHGPFKHFICSYENTHPLLVADGIPYVIMRDPYNWYASVYRFFKNRPIVRDRGGTQALIPLYLEFYKYVKMNPSRLINYNYWFMCYDYRRKLEDKWVFDKNDSTLNIVPNYGDGSTFDGMNYNKKAQKMKVLDRWELVKHEDDYVNAILNYPILLDISIELFNFAPNDSIFNSHKAL